MKKKKFEKAEPYNPLEPRFKLRDDKGELVTYGAVQGSTVQVKYFKTQTDLMDPSLKS